MTGKLGRWPPVWPWGPTRGRGMLKAGRNVLSSAAVGLVPLLQWLRQKRHKKSKMWRKSTKTKTKQKKPSKNSFRDAGVFSVRKTTGGRMQGLVSDTRWSMMCTDSTSSVLMMDVRISKINMGTNIIWVCQTGRNQREMCTVVNNHTWKLLYVKILWTLNSTCPAAKSAKRSTVKYLKMLFNPVLIESVWGYHLPYTPSSIWLWGTD